MNIGPATYTPNNRSTPGTSITCGRSWLELENNMEYTIVEGDYDEHNLRWIVMSNGNGAIWGTFATLIDAMMYVLASVNVELLIGASYVW
jgi:hypothetical protein